MLEIRFSRKEEDICGLDGRKTSFTTHCYIIMNIQGCLLIRRENLLSHGSQKRAF